MSLEQDEQLVQEIVGQVLTASIEDHEKVDPEFTVDQTADFTDELPSNISVSTAVPLVTEEGVKTPQGEQKEDMTGVGHITMDNKEEIGLTDNSEIDGSGEESIVDDKLIDNEQSNPDNAQFPQLHTDALPVVTATDELNSSAGVIDEVVSPKNLETKFGSDNEGEKENMDHKISMGIFEEDSNADDNKGFEPITPPAFGNNSLQEEHKLGQHEQQQQLFSNAEEKVTDSGEESDMPLNLGKANGNDTDMGKSNGTSTAGLQEKSQPKAKTKLCTIL